MSGLPAVASQDIAQKVYLDSLIPTNRTLAKAVGQGVISIDQPEYVDGKKAQLRFTVDVQYPDAQALVKKVLEDAELRADEIQQPNATSYVVSGASTDQLLRLAEVFDMQTRKELVKHGLAMVQGAFDGKNAEEVSYLLREVQYGINDMQSSTRQALKHGLKSAVREDNSHLWNML